MWALLAPGPSASAEDAERVRSAGLPLVAITSAFGLAPWADFIAATDGGWWRKYPDSIQLEGRKYTMHESRGAETDQVPGDFAVNSGSLVVERYKPNGSTRV